MRQVIVSKKGSVVMPSQMSRELLGYVDGQEARILRCVSRNHDRVAIPQLDLQLAVNTRQCTHVWMTSTAFDCILKTGELVDILNLGSGLRLMAGKRGPDSDYYLFSRGDTVPDWDVELVKPEDSPLGMNRTVKIASEERPCDFLIAAAGMEGNMHNPTMRRLITEMEKRGITKLLIDRDSGSFHFD